MSTSSPAAATEPIAEVAGRHGRFRYLPHDIYIGASLAAYGEYSERELELVVRLAKPGATVVEVGANIGVLTVPLARHVGPTGRLIAFEPQAAAFEVLAANLALNDLGRVEAVHAAVGAVAGTVWLPTPDYARAGNFGGVGLGAPGVGEPVEQVRLDDVIEGCVHLLKIDAEGAEQAILEGAAGLIGRHRPLLYLENDRLDRSADLIRCLFGLRYRLFWHLPPLFNPDNHFRNAENLFPHIVSVNMLGVPAERRIGTSSREVIDLDFHPMRRQAPAR